MWRDEGDVRNELADAEACLRRGDLEGALRLVAELPRGTTTTATADPTAQATRQRLRLRGALQYRLVEAPGLSAEAREDVRVSLALGTLFGMGVPQLVERVWPVITRESYSFLALDRFVQRLLRGDRRTLDGWLQHILDGMAGPDRERVRAELLVHHAYFAVLHSTELVEIERRLLARPPQLLGVRVQALRPSGCPVCDWPDVTFRPANLAELPVLPAHPGCRCVYRPVTIRGQ
jgi:hypothetical protein